MKRLWLCCSCVALAVAILTAANSAALATWLSTGWDDTELSKEACLDRAEAAIQSAGFRITQRTEWSRFGVRGEYTVSVRCIPEKKLVFFIGGGPEGEENSKNNQAVQNNFTK